MQINYPVEFVKVEEPPSRDTGRSTAGQSIPWGNILDEYAGQGWFRIDYTSSDESNYMEYRPEQLAHNLRVKHGVQATARRGSVYISVPEDR